jgi:hypothetical protein
MNKEAAYRKLISSAMSAGRAARTLPSAPQAATRALNGATQVAASRTLKPATLQQVVGPRLQVAGSRPKITMSALKNALGKAVANSTANYHNLYPYMAMGPEAFRMAAAAKAGAGLFNKIVNRFS